jgi:L-fuculose-phosphate aldolase
MLLFEERRAVTQYAQQLLSSGLVQGTSGNISVANANKTLVAITPSGVAYEDMVPEDVVVVGMQGMHIDGRLLPSSELKFHLALIKQRPDIFAVVHTHSENATAMACLRWELPPIHYLIGYAGMTVPLAPYATFGSQALTDGICHTIGDGNAVLLANHGMVAVGPTLKSAFNTAQMVEYVARLYLLTKSVGDPVLLSPEEMKAVLEKFPTYGAQPTRDQS